jgi:Leucine-rich repeat (LRR) protein
MCSITDEGIKNISGLINLEYLTLYRTKVTDEGIKHLVNLKKLKKLELDETNITDKSVPYIIEMMGNKQDKYDTYLIIYETKISRKGVKKLLEAGIQVNCDYKDLSSEIP